MAESSNNLALLQSKLLAAQNCHPAAVQTLISESLDTLDLIARAPQAVAAQAPAAVAVTEAQIDAILDEPGGMIFYVSDQRHRQHLFARRVLALATPALPATEQAANCTCPSGDGSLRWPCPEHPPSQPAPAGEYPALPDPDHALDCGMQPFYRPDQMRAFADATHAMRAGEQEPANPTRSGESNGYGAYGKVRKILEHYDCLPVASGPLVADLVYGIADFVLAATSPVATQGEQPMVNMSPPATSRDRWMYEQGRLAERDARTPESVAATELSAQRWRMLPAFYEEYQIDGLKLMRDIDAAMAAAQEGGKDSAGKDGEA